MTYDVVTPIEIKIKGVPKTKWHRIGRAWSDNEEKITVVLDSVPFRSEYIYLFKSDIQIPKPLEQE